MNHRFIVDINTERYTDAHIVMMERLGYDEDYGFPYTVEWNDA